MKVAVRFVTPLATAFLWMVATSTSALADSPASGDWPAPPERSMLDNLILFGGGTVALFVVIWLFGVLTARNNYVPPEPGTDLVSTSGNAPAQH